MVGIYGAWDPAKRKTLRVLSAAVWFPAGSGLDAGTDLWEPLGNMCGKPVSRLRVFADASRGHALHAQDRDGR